MRANNPGQTLGTDFPKWSWNHFEDNVFTKQAKSKLSHKGGCLQNARIRFILPILGVAFLFNLLFSGGGVLKFPNQGLGLLLVNRDSPNQALPSSKETVDAEFKMTSLQKKSTRKRGCLQEALTLFNVTVLGAALLSNLLVPTKQVSLSHLLRMCSSFAGTCSE